MRLLKISQKEHTNVFELLPWYINRRLDAEENNEVEEHIEKCFICKQESEYLQEVFDSFPHKEIVINDNFTTTLRRIDEYEERGFIPPKESSENIKRIFTQHQYPYWMSIAASFLLILTIVKAPFWNSMTVDPDYQVLTSSESVSQQSITMSVHFKHPMSEQQVEELLKGQTGVVDIKWVENDHFLLTLSQDEDANALNLLLKKLTILNEVASFNVALDNQ